MSLAHSQWRRVSAYTEHAIKTDDFVLSEQNELAACSNGATRQPPSRPPGLYPWWEIEIETDRAFHNSMEGAYKRGE